MHCCQNHPRSKCMADMPRAVRMSCTQAYRLECCMIRVNMIGYWTTER